jgi:hypothetical protein
MVVPWGEARAQSPAGVVFTSFFFITKLVDDRHWDEHRLKPREPLLEATP